MGKHTAEAPRHAYTNEEFDNLVAGKVRDREELKKLIMKDYEEPIEGPLDEDPDAETLPSEAFEAQPMPSMGEIFSVPEGTEVGDWANETYDAIVRLFGGAPSKFAMTTLLGHVIREAGYVARDDERRRLSRELRNTRIEVASEHLAVVLEVRDALAKMIAGDNTTTV